jgi:hypothetical protein
MFSLSKHAATCWLEATNMQQAWNRQASIDHAVASRHAELHQHMKPPQAARSLKTTIIMMPFMMNDAFYPQVVKHSATQPGW